MAALNLTNIKSVVAGDTEILNFIRASRVTQEITDFTSDVAVTLRNPHKICNSTDTAGLIYIKLVGDDAFYPEYFAAGQEKTLAVAEVGSSTAVTKVLIRGV